MQLNHCEQGKADSEGQDEDGKMALLCVLRHWKIEAGVLRCIDGAQFAIGIHWRKRGIFILRQFLK